MRTYSITLLLIGMLLVSLATIIGCGEKKQSAKVEVPEVQVVTVSLMDVPIVSEWVGTLDGAVNAEIKAKVQGYIISQNYKEGTKVKKDDVLFEIDPRPFQVVLAENKGKLARAKATLTKYQQDVSRYGPLVKRGSISRQEYDDAVQNELAAQADLESAQAQVEQAQLNLDYTKVVSPVDGVAGIAKANVGDLVGPATISVLTTVSQLDPMKVYFPVSEKEYLAASKKINEYANQVAAGVKQEGFLDLILSDGSTYSHKGWFDIADRAVDQNTGTMQIVALFPNPDDLLRPGIFCKVRSAKQRRIGVVVIPQRSVGELQGNYQVAVVDAQNKVTIQPIKLGQQVGGFYIIDSGLKTGQRVVLEGPRKYRMGTEVTVSESDADYASIQAVKTASNEKIDTIEGTSEM